MEAASRTNRTLLHFDFNCYKIFKNKGIKLIFLEDF